MELETRLLREDKMVLTKGSFIDLEYVLHILEGGSLTFQNEEDRFTVKEGDIIFIRPNTLHAIMDDKETMMTVIHFLEHSHRLEGMDIPPTLTMPQEDFKHILYLVELLKSNWPAFDHGQSAICNGLTESIVGFYLRTSMQVRPPRPRYQFKNWESVKLAVQYIQLNAHDPELSVETVSAHVQLSYNYFSSLFKKYTNDNPLNFITRVRLERAKNMLFNHQKNISETAVSCGFHSVQNFSKTFRKYEGMSPSEWLKSV